MRTSVVTAPLLVLALLSVPAALAEGGLDDLPFQCGPVVVNDPANDVAVWSGVTSPVRPGVSFAPDVDIRSVSLDRTANDDMVLRAEFSGALPDEDDDKVAYSYEFRFEIYMVAGDGYKQDWIEVHVDEYPYTQAKFVGGEILGDFVFMTVDVDRTDATVLEITFDHGSIEGAHGGRDVAIGSPELIARMAHTDIAGVTSSEVSDIAEWRRDFLGPMAC